MGRVLAYDEQVLTDTGVGEAITTANDASVVASEASTAAAAAQQTSDDIRQQLSGDEAYSDGTHDVFYNVNGDYYYYLNEGIQVVVAETNLDHEYTDDNDVTHALIWDSANNVYYYEYEGTTYTVSPDDAALVSHYTGGALDDITADIRTVTGTVGDLTDELTAVSGKADQTEAIVNDIAPEIEKMRGMIVLDPTVPEIVVKAGDNNVQITEDKVALRVGTKEVAYIDQEKMYITQAEIYNNVDLTKSTLRIGPFMWVVQSKDRISLRYLPVKEE